MAATSALGFEPILSKLGIEAARVPPVLLKLEEEREEEEEDEEDETDEDETLGWRRTDIPYVRLRFEYNSLRNVTRK